MSFIEIGKRIAPGHDCLRLDVRNKVNGASAQLYVPRKLRLLLRWEQVHPFVMSYGAQEDAGSIMISPASKLISDNTRIMRFRERGGASISIPYKSLALVADVGVHPVPILKADPDRRILIMDFLQFMDAAPQLKIVSTK